MARARTVERCLAAQRRTGRQLVFALGTALDLRRWLYVQVTAENLADESSQEMLAERVAQRMSQHSAKPVKLRGRMIVREIVDGRRKHG